MSDDDLVRILHDWCDAYPENVFPTPPEDQRAKDSAAADVMRVMALPMFKRCADEIERLREMDRQMRDALDSLGLSVSQIWDEEFEGWQASLFVAEEDRCKGEPCCCWDNAVLITKNLAEHLEVSP